MSDYLFAYGTLQPGCAPGYMESVAARLEPGNVPAQIASVAAKLRPVGKGWVQGFIYDLGRYPGAVPDPNAAGEIFGTVMELPDDASFLGQLDAYEGYDPRAPEASEYVRVRQVVEMNAGGTMECWIYRYNLKVDAARRIASGEWPKSCGQ